MESPLGSGAPQNYSLGHINFAWNLGQLVLVIVNGHFNLGGGIIGGKNSI